MQREKTHESAIELYFLTKAKKAGAICRKLNSPSTRGLPDRMVLLNGHIFFVEFKSANGKLSNYQKYIFEEMDEHGFPVHIIRSKGEVDIFCKNTLYQIAKLKPSVS